MGENKMVRTLILASIVLFSATILSASTVIRDKIETFPRVIDDGRPFATEVDLWRFVVTRPDYVTIDVLSWDWDPDGDGFANHLDSEIYVFHDDGQIDVDDVIVSNDDSRRTFNDGSTSPLDSFIEWFLEAGEYILAIGEVGIGPGDAIRQRREFSFYPQVVRLSDGFPEANGEGCVEFDCSFADYQLTFTGPVVFDQPVIAQTPVPAGWPLMLTALAGIAGVAWHRRRT